VPLVQKPRGGKTVSKMEIGCLGIPRSPGVPITLDHSEGVLDKLDPPSLLLVRGHVCPFVHVEAKRCCTAGSLSPRQSLWCAIKVPPGKGKTPKKCAVCCALLVSGKRGHSLRIKIWGHYDDGMGLKEWVTEYGGSVLDSIVL
jgi:hypothetical protein